MNFLAHAEVARRLPRSGDDVVLGAMLPDLAHLVPIRVARQRFRDELADGWACHLATDQAFHADPRFRLAISGMARRLRDQGWPRWPAHAAAHVSWELLLDGRWALRSDPAMWFPAVLRSRAFLDLLDATERGHWERLVQLQALRPLWTSYVEPGAVAWRTWRRLQATTVGFDAGGIPQLAALLQAELPAVEHLAEPLVEAGVAATLGTALTASPGGGPGFQGARSARAGDVRP
jgi:hypothetical protein